MSKNFISQSLFIGNSEGKGRGVFTKNEIKKGTVIEVSPVMVFNETDRQWLEKTKLYDYIFEWGELGKKCCVAFGLVSLYNHASESNCEYEMNFDSEDISIVAVRDIAAGEEILVNYHGNSGDGRKVWFQTGEP